MESVQKFLLFTVAAFITLGAVTLSLETNFMIDKAYEKEGIIQKDPSLIQKLTIPEKTKIYGSEIVGKLYLYYGQDFQIVVDGYTYSVNNADISNQDFSSKIDVKAIYEEIIARDSAGQVQTITYTKEVP